SSPGRICLEFKKGRTRSIIAWADGGFTPKRARTEASVSPRRSFTPTRGGSSAATGGGGFGFCFLFRRGPKGGPQTQGTSSNGKAGKTNCRGTQTMSQGRVKIFSLLHHDERRFRSLYSNIDPRSKKK